MRKLLTGVCNNVTQNIDKILLWKNSFHQVVPEGSVVLLAYNPTPSDIKTLEDNNIAFLNVSGEGTETVNNQRLVILSDFLRDYSKFYDVVFNTDVFDVAFLKDPFKKLDLAKYDIFVGGESMLHYQEPWNTDVMHKCFPEYLQATKDQEIYCSGVMAGRPLQLSKFLLDMVKTTLTSKKGHDIEDQAAMNIIIHQNDKLQDEKYRLKKFEITEDWCLHMAICGPTQFFESWGFKDRIKERYGITPDWKDYDIVHQFNRIPEIHKQIKDINGL